MASLRVNVFYGIKSDGMRHVSRIEVNNVFNSFFWNIMKQFFGCFAMRVNETHAMSRHDIGNHHIHLQIGFSRARLADYIHMAAAIVGFDAEFFPLIAEICFCKICYSVICHIISANLPAVRLFWPQPALKSALQRQKSDNDKLSPVLQY